MKPGALALPLALALVLPGCVAPAQPPAARAPAAPADGPPGEVLGSTPAADPGSPSSPTSASGEGASPTSAARADPAPAPRADTAAAPPPVRVPGMSAMEVGVAAAVNRLRRDPAALVAELQRHRALYRGKYLYLPGMDGPIITFEGVAAVDEAIGAARRAKPRPALRLSPGLSRAAHRHAVEIGRAGTIDHVSRDGSTPERRMGREGRVRGMSGEDIGTGYGGADVMVLSLFIDDGVPSRGHRTNLLERSYRAVGVGCAPHAQWGTVCVLDFAAGFAE